MLLEQICLVSTALKSILEWVGWLMNDELGSVCEEADVA
jgi:hypothetical protein